MHVCMCTCMFICKHICMMNARHTHTHRYTPTFTIYVCTQKCLRLWLGQVSLKTWGNFVSFFLRYSSCKYRSRLLICMLARTHAYRACQRHTTFPCISRKNETQFRELQISMCVQAKPCVCTYQQGKEYICQVVPKFLVCSCRSIKELDKTITANQQSLTKQGHFWLTLNTICMVFMKDLRN